MRAVAGLEGAVWGMFVGDAYCLGSHLIDDAEAFRLRFPTGPEGFAQPAAGHVHVGRAEGEPTPHGEAARILLDALANGDHDAEAYRCRLQAISGTDEMTTDRGQAPQRRVGPVEPVAAEACDDAGAEDCRNVTPARLAPVVVAYAGTPRLMLAVDTFTRVLQDSDTVVAYACAHARLLESLLAGATLDVALDALVATIDRRTSLGSEIADGVDAARELRGMPVPEATTRLGCGASLSSAFPAALQAALAHEADFAAAISATAAARGDNASRAMLVGSWLGARLGVDAVPADWRGRLVDAPAIDRSLARVLARRPAPPMTTRH